MDALPGDSLPALIARLRAGEDAAWTAFVERFAPPLLQAARSVERDPDAVADAFVFTCERLRERNDARLGAFDFDRAGQRRLGRFGLTGHHGGHGALRRPERHGTSDSGRGLPGSVSASTKENSAITFTPPSPPPGNGWGL